MENKYTTNPQVTQQKSAFIPKGTYYNRTDEPSCSISLCIICGKQATNEPMVSTPLKSHLLKVIIIWQVSMLMLNTYWNLKMKPNLCFKTHTHWIDWRYKLFSSTTYCPEKENLHRWQGPNNASMFHYSE